MKKYVLLLGVAVIVGLVSYTFFGEEEELADPYAQIEEEEPGSSYRYGFDESTHAFIDGKIEKGQFLADILLPYIDYPEMERLLHNSKEEFNPRAIRVGRDYHVVTSKDSVRSSVAFIYENDPVHYTVLHLGDSLYASRGEKPIRTELAQAEGVVESSLYLSLTEQGLSQVLALEMADIYAWTIDFYRLQKGDQFKVLFEKRFIEDEFVGIGEVKACFFTHKDREFKAYRFQQEGQFDYFDEEGQGMRKAFLKSPLKFGRMTSGFTNRRFHPVQRRWKAHKGTDYAAPTGTPILATGDGEVIKSAYTKNNGNYVKIRHNSTYTTQYLHMSKRGVQVGQQVQQGEVIGYVGSTGLATGPHVCYRFWKNGKQVDHRKEDFPSADPILPENMEQFLAHVQELNRRMGSSSHLLAER